MVPYRSVFEGLSKLKIRYLVAGGFAVNFHQVQRATVDLDLIIEIEKENILQFISLMDSLNYTPRLPVPAADFANSELRKKWIHEKGMLVFTFISKTNPFEVIDVFSEEPIPFDALWKDRLDVSAFNLTIPVIGKDHLIALKQLANRDKDKFDIEQLRKIKT